MAQKAMLTLTGRQRDQNGEESVAESRAEAQYYEKDGSSYIFYEELPEDSRDAVKNRIKFKDGLLEMTKRGPVRSRMVFQAGRTHRADYVTLYGTLPLEVATHKAEIRRLEGRTEIRLEYTLLSGGQFLSRCALDICLRFAER